MPEWMHDRADHIRAKNPSMPKSEAFAIATQQMHALGKSPKGYGTAEGRRTAKAKFDTPKDDKKMANPGHLKAAEALQECMKEAGMRIDYDLHGNAVRAQTHNEILADIFRRDGSFMVPQSLHKMASFLDELHKIALGLPPPLPAAAVKKPATEGFHALMQGMNAAKAKGLGNPLAGIK